MKTELDILKDQLEFCKKQFEELATNRNVVVVSFALASLDVLADWNKFNPKEPTGKRSSPGIECFNGA